jgi:hypothetical protein
VGTINLNTTSNFVLYQALSNTKRRFTTKYVVVNLNFADAEVAPVDGN